jgi:oligoendopeptidase F
MHMATEVPTRADIAPQYTWNAPSVFPTGADWKAEYDRLMQEVPTLARFQGHLADSPAALADWLDTLEAITQRVGHVLFYGLMSQSVDSSDPEAVAMGGQATSLYGRLQAAAAFSEPELLAIGHGKLQQWMAQEARLQPYAHTFDNLFRRQAHIRTAEVEEVLGLSTDVMAMIEQTAEMLANADIHFNNAVSAAGEARPVTQGTLGKLLQDRDREVRRTAYENYADGYLSFKNTFASNLLGSYKRDVFIARVHRYPSSLEASLFENNIPVAVYNNLIETYRKNIPTWHRYWAVRRRALGVGHLYPYDIWAPLTQGEPEIAYEQAVDWIAEGMRPLGDEYADVLRRGTLEERWVDVYPTKGKRQGAFSFGWRGTHPFIMMSYTNSLFALSTLAHELGHSMHSYLTWQHQPAQYSDVSLFVAEVASNFNQALVRAHLMQQNDDPQFQIALIEEAMSNFHRYFFIMPTLARFELEIHQRVERGEGVTAEDMISLMADLFAEGYGDEMTFDREQVGITWAQFGHLYSSYYVYQYATGISAAHALARRVLSGEQDAAGNYVKFLSAGGSLYPIDALKLAGVDMTKPDAVEQTFATLSEYVDRLDALTSK